MFVYVGLPSFPIFYLSVLGGVGLPSFAWLVIRTGPILCISSSLRRHDRAGLAMEPISPFSLSVFDLCNLFSPKLGMTIRLEEGNLANMTLSFDTQKDGDVVLSQAAEVAPADGREIAEMHWRTTKVCVGIRVLFSETEAVV